MEMRLIAIGLTASLLAVAGGAGAESNDREALHILTASLNLAPPSSHNIDDLDLAMALRIDMHWMRVSSPCDRSE